MYCSQRRATLEYMPVRRDTTLHLILTHPDGRRVARHTVGVDTTTYYGANVAEAARAAGLPARLLRRLAFTFHGEQEGVLRAESVWHIHLEAEPEAAVTWTSAHEWAVDERRWAEAALSLHTPRRAPWFNPIWHAGALTWLDEQLRTQGLVRLDEPTVLKHWQISLLWRVRTSGGPVYFKAVPDFLRREVQVTRLLAAHLPGAAAPVLAADEERGFLLLADAGADVDSPDLPALLRHLAGVQRASLPLLPRLDLDVRGPAHIRTRLNRLLSDEVLMLDQEGGLTRPEAEQLRAQRSVLEAALTRLDASPLPLTLGHGDLHGGNVVECAGQFTLLDWSDACVTHPFLDANAAYLLPHGTAGAPEALAEAHAAYLGEWSDLAPLDDLKSLHTDAVRVGELLRTLGYVDGIQRHVEDKSEWHGVHLDHLRKLLN